jgi:beta-galactosidase
MKASKRIIHLPIISLVAVMVFSCAPERSGELTNDMPGPRSEILFDFGWKFHRGDMQGAELPEFDDASWKSVDLPHDYSIEDLPGADSPFDASHPDGIDAGFLTNGTAWYRKSFMVPDKLESKEISILFDGVYMNADVWLNGEHLGNHPYGYTAFGYDISDLLRYGEKNVIAIEVKNEGENSRWYSGSGIYRHVYIRITEPVHIARWGTGITTPVIHDSEATVIVSNTIENESEDAQELNITTTIIDAEGNEAARSTVSRIADTDDDLMVVQELEIKEPGLWFPESPTLYTSVTEIGSAGSGILDRVEVVFGIRSIEYTTDGFFLNGENLLVRGGCMHHDNGPLGSAAYDRAEERRVELMKASGFNAIRCAHNPPSSAFLEACDRLGMLVIDESFDMWSRQKNPQDYHLYFKDWWKRDIESMVLRDRNHPSVIIWSIGNEIPERADPLGVETSQMMGNHIKKLDNSRPVTSAVNGLNPDKDAFFATLDVAGYNYAVGDDHWQESIYQQDHKRVPERIIYCSESFPLTAYGSWMAVLDLPYVFGDFVWTGFDYLGEASIGWLGYPHRDNFYPWNHAFCGDLDICGQKRPQSYYRDVLWQHEEGTPVSIFVKPPVPTFEMIPGKKEWSKWNWHDIVADWNWEGYEGEILEVNVYCMYPEVELFLNGHSQGKKKTNRESQWIAKYQVPYQAGELKAIAYAGPLEKGSCILNTAASAAYIKLSADRESIHADGQDLSYIMVELLDQQGTRHPKADDLVNFSIKGPGSIAAVASSNPKSVESFQQPRRKAYQGRCMVIIKSGQEAGTITLKAEAEGLAPTEIQITTEI